MTPQCQTGPVGIERSATVGDPPADPAGDAVAATALEILADASVEQIYSPIDAPEPLVDSTSLATASATGPGPHGWRLTLVIHLSRRIAPLVTAEAPLVDILGALPEAALRAAAQFRYAPGTRSSLTPSMRRALRDTVVVEVLGLQNAVPWGDSTHDLFAEIIEYLIELSGTRVESHDLTHGVLVADVFDDTPKLHFDYPADLRDAKRGPLLFDGDRALLIVDPRGRARTELQRHRLARVIPDADQAPVAEPRRSGWLVAEATRQLGGIGFFLRSDRSIWTYRGGNPMVVRRGEHWTAFPLELEALIDKIIGGGTAASLVVKTAMMISAAPQGAILAIVDDPASLDGYVQLKDRYDLRNASDPTAMRVETRLHHLIDAKSLDAPTLARLAALDGATVLDAEGRLLAYGAIVMSHDSQHEGARTAAAKTLSEIALVVLKVSVDGDITVFTRGQVLARVLTQRTRIR